MIRKAGKQDLDAVYTLVCELEQEVLDKQSFQTFYMRNIDHPDYLYLVEEREQGILGFVSLFLHHPLHHSALIGEIEELCVQEQYRGHHIGTDLMAEIKQQAKRIGCHQIELSCHHKRTQAHAFYHKQAMKQEHMKFTYQWEDKQ